MRHATIDSLVTLILTWAVLASFSHVGEYIMTKAQTPDIRHEGKEIILPGDPKPMELDAAIAWLQQVKRDQDTFVTVTEIIDAFPMDGAHALMLAIQEVYGTATERPWGNHTISVPCGPGQTVQVPWGEFKVPGLNGTLETEMAYNERGQRAFAISATVPKRHKADVKALAEVVRRIVKERSLYRGKALEWRDADTAPAFLDLSGVSASDLQFPADVREQYETTLLTPLRDREACLDAGIPFKRATALVGPYGTGKTMAIHVAALEAISHGIMFLQVTNASEFQSAMMFARQYGPALIACEDIDQVTQQRDRTCEAIMEALDGLQAKDQDVAVVFTSNHVERIHPAMRRPGRIDTFIHVALPDVDTIGRLLRQYAHGLVDAHYDLTEVAAMLVGHIPAEIREVAELAKLAAIRERGRVDYLTPEDLAVAARCILRGERLFEDDSDADRKSLEQMAVFGTQLVQGIVKAVGWQDLDSAMRARPDVTPVPLNARTTAYKVQH